MADFINPPAVVGNYNGRYLWTGELNFGQKIFYLDGITDHIAGSRRLLYSGTRWVIQYYTGITYQTSYRNRLAGEGNLYDGSWEATSSYGANPGGHVGYCDEIMSGSSWSSESSQSSESTGSSLSSLSSLSSESSESSSPSSLSSVSSLSSGSSLSTSSSLSSVSSGSSLSSGSTQSSPSSQSTANSQSLPPETSSSSSSRSSFSSKSSPSSSSSSSIDERKGFSALAVALDRLFQDESQCHDLRELCLGGIWYGHVPLNCTDPYMVYYSRILDAQKYRSFGNYDDLVEIQVNLFDSNVPNPARIVQMAVEVNKAIEATTQWHLRENWEMNGITEVWENGPTSTGYNEWQMTLLFRVWTGKPKA